MNEQVEADKNSTDEFVNKFAEKLYIRFYEEQKTQGFHPKNKCPNKSFFRNKCDMCLEEMVSNYNDLTEKSKNIFKEMAMHLNIDLGTLDYKINKKIKLSDDIEFNCDAIISKLDEDGYEIVAIAAVKKDGKPVDSRLIYKTPIDKHKLSTLLRQHAHRIENENLSQAKVIKVGSKHGG